MDMVGTMEGEGERCDTAEVTADSSACPAFHERVLLWAGPQRRGCDGGAVAALAAPAPPDFNREIRPLLSDVGYALHQLAR